MEKMPKEGFSYLIQGTKSVRTKSMRKKGTLTEHGVYCQFSAKDDEEARKKWKSYTQPIGGSSDKTQIRYNTQLLKLTATKLA